MVRNPIRTTGIAYREVERLISSLIGTSVGVTSAVRKSDEGVDVFLYDAGAGARAHLEVYRRAMRALSRYVYGVGESTLRDGVCRLLLARRKTLALAESLTGGLISDRITDVPGSSEFFMLSVVTYSNEAKTRILDVPPSVMERWGAVSRQTCRRMVEGLSLLGDFSYRVAVTGTAGPAGGSMAKPVGTVFAGIGEADAITVKKFSFAGTRREIKEATCREVMRLLWTKLSGP
jgi:nicotinamide-nucleotide amidase